MPLSIGVNLRVTGHCNQGGRKYMEDMFSVAYQQSSNDRELEYAFFGIFDGHGGGEAATFAKENLMDIIVKQKNFWSDNDDDVLKAIRDGYVNTHYAMWRELEKWPRTASGLPSTAGTTASIAFIRKGKIYIGHVGDSAIILGYQEKGDPLWKSKALTRDHKPECGTEMTRIQESGGKVVSKSGVPRVVWNRPRIGHKGPVRRSTHIDEIPFLAVARSLGDLWSYNSELNTFVVSPEPDVKVVKIDIKSYRCLIFGTDGLWNMLSPQAAVSIVQAAERHNEKHLIASQQTGHGHGDAQMWINPSKSLVDRALDRWSSTRLRADNTSVVTLMLDPPGPTHNEILLSQKREQMATSKPPVNPVPRTPEPFTETSEIIQNDSPSAVSEPKVSRSRSIPSPFPLTPLPSRPPPSYPDSSNHEADGRIGQEKITKSSPLSKEKPVPGDCLEDLQSEESIQVAEISSSNVTDELGDRSADDSVIDADMSVVESSLNESSTRESEMDTESCDASSLLESEKVLQQVPDAERFQQSNNNMSVDHKLIRISEPRLRRSIHDPISSNGNRCTTRRSTAGCVTLLQKTRRRHSSGTPNQRQHQPTRRSLTPKSTTITRGTFLGNSNRLKRGAKLMLAENGQSGREANSRSSDGCKLGGQDDILCSETSSKRRTRSEDMRTMQDENNPNQIQNLNDQHQHKARWPSNETPLSRNSGMLNTSVNSNQETRRPSPNSFKRRNLEKKVSPTKAIRRITMNRSINRLQMRDKYWEQSRATRAGSSCPSNSRQAVVNSMSTLADPSPSPVSSSAPKRWLRSDTVAATPIKTLRSRNVEIANNAGPSDIAPNCISVKPNRLLETQPKLKIPSTASDMLTTPITPQCTVESKLRTPMYTPTPNRGKSNCVTPISNNPCISSTPSSTSSSMSKRAKTPYNPSARSLTTRSRIKRLSK
ncbi:hypothetical protein QAD02_023371 [Eretmocerus hayati]|uniref:Uncharacterized protein n=1 Tax=Eretmocerus hayati TaxID=131215 RepID=A0ACC2PVU4_9HYME|nr:hypothetical protein QAD02_023371 [Eretmocerus hayati]